MTFPFLLFLGGMDKVGKTYDGSDLPPQTQAISDSQGVDPKQTDDEQKKSVTQLIDDKCEATLTPGPPPLGMESKNLPF